MQHQDFTHFRHFMSDEPRLSKFAVEVIISVQLMHVDRLNKTTLGPIERVNELIRLEYLVQFLLVLGCAGSRNL
jgi:hypothetical protein